MLGLKLDHDSKRGPLTENYVSYLCEVQLSNLFRPANARGNGFLVGFFYLESERFFRQKVLFENVWSMAAILSRGCVIVHRLNLPSPLFCDLNPTRNQNTRFAFRNAIYCGPVIWCKTFRNTKGSWFDEIRSEPSVVLAQDKHVRHVKLC